jgi:membrane-associated phospholipid phosphatase
MDVVGTGTGEDEMRDASVSSVPSTSLENAESGLSRYTVIAVWSVIAVFAVITLARSVAVDVPIRDPGGKIVLERLGIAVEWLLALVLANALGASLWRHRSLRALPRVLRERWPWRRVWPVGMAVIAYHLVYVCYRNLKSWDAFNGDRDHELQAVDRVIFGGQTPAVLLHDLFGEHTAAIVFADIYNSFPKLVTVSVVGTLVFVRPVSRAYLFLCSMIWVWILGTATYYAVPSLGPFATDPQDFAGLTETAVTRSQQTYLEQRAHLLTNPAAHDAYSSISAFASLHVGVTCVILLMAHRYGHRRLAVALGVYLAAVMVSTIYVGMHFVVDDVAGVLIAMLAVRLGQLTVGRSVSPRREPEQEPEQEPERETAA